MKIFVFTLFLFLSLLATRESYAGNTTLTSNYPAPSGSYNHIVITTQATTNVICTAANNGLIFMGPNNTLEVCAKQTTGAGSAPFTVPSGETCFNQFSNTSGQTCPPYYSSPSASIMQADSFTTSTGFTVYSTICCSSPTTAIVNGHTQTLNPIVVPTS